MSGGHWDYKNDELYHEIFGWEFDFHSKTYERRVMMARNKNPLEDKELSELVMDVFSLLHSYDWYASGDTDQPSYMNDVMRFKKKWLECSFDDRVKREIQKTLREGEAELRKSLIGIGPER